MKKFSVSFISLLATALVPAHAMEKQSDTDLISLVTSQRAMMHARRVITAQETLIAQLHAEQRQKRKDELLTVFTAAIERKVGQRRKTKIVQKYELKSQQDQQAFQQRMETLARDHQEQLRQKDASHAQQLQNQLQQHRNEQDQTTRQLQQTQANLANSNATSAAQQQQAQARQQELQNQLQQQRNDHAQINGQLQQAQAAHAQEGAQLRGLVQQAQANLANANATSAAQQQQAQVRHQELQQQLNQVRDAHTQEGAQLRALVQQGSVNLANANAASVAQQQQAQARQQELQNQLQQAQARQQGLQNQLNQTQVGRQQLQATYDQLAQQNQANIAEKVRLTDVNAQLTQQLARKTATLNALISRVAHELNLYRSEIVRMYPKKWQRLYIDPDQRLWPYKQYFALSLHREELGVCLRLLKGYPCGQRLNYKQELVPLFASPESYINALTVAAANN